MTLGCNTTKSMIIENAIMLFYEKGYTTATLRELAGRCGLTHPALFRHFINKADLASILEYRYVRGVLKVTQRFMAERAKLSQPLSRDESCIFYWAAHYHYVKQDSKFCDFINQFYMDHFKSYLSHDYGYMTQIFSQLFQMDDAKTQDEQTLKTMIMVSMIALTSTAFFQNKISFADAISQTYRTSFALLKLTPTLTDSKIDLFLSELDSERYLQYNILNDFLLTDFGEPFQSLSYNLFE